MALVTVVLIGSHACCDWIVMLNVCRFVPGATANVQVVGPVLLASPSRSIVNVPVQVPARNDCDVDGVVGACVPPPQAVARPATVMSAHSPRCVFMRPLLP